MTDFGAMRLLISRMHPCIAAIELYGDSAAKSREDLRCAYFNFKDHMDKFLEENKDNELAYERQMRIVAELRDLPTKQRNIIIKQAKEPK